MKIIQLMYFEGQLLGLSSEGDIYLIDLLNLSAMLMMRNPLS